MTTKRYMPDGSPIPAGVKTSRRAKAGDKIFGLKKGNIVRVVYPDNETESTTDKEVEYVLNIDGQNYPGAIDMRSGGSINNFGTRVRKGFDVSRDGKVDTSTFDENTDSEMVYALFLNGHPDIPIVIASASHPRQREGTQLKEEDGQRWIEEYNGVEFLIDKDSNISITQVGRRDTKTEGNEIINEDAVGTFVKLFGNGDIHLIAPAEDDADSVKAIFTKAAKSLFLQASKNSALLDAIGITMTDLSGNKIEMKAAGKTETIEGAWVVNITGDATITAGGNLTAKGGDVLVEATGSAKIKSGGPCDIEAAGAVNIKAAGNTNNGGVVTDNTINNDPITGLPLTGVGGTTTT